MSKLLVVDDEQSICWALAKLGNDLGLQVQTAASAEEGLQLAARWSPDLIVLDVRLPGMDGLTALQEFRSLLADTPIVLITAFGQLETAVQAVRSGANDYVLKPFDLAEIQAAIERALQSSEVRPRPAVVDVSDHMIGSSPVMQSLFKRIALAAAAETNVLLQGESGAGKELAARAIHRYSARSDSPFVAVNIAALSPSLAESELFGHVEGAFTGAQRSRDGLLVKANGGTLFLDEVAEIPLTIQVKLLRALEQGEVLPVGGDQPVATSFRVVSATHQDLNQLMRCGDFRHDLFFRLCGFEIAIPPLRHRGDDVVELAYAFANRLAHGKLTFAEETLDEIRRRAWYGNVRELRNAVEHAAVVASGKVAYPEHLPPPQPALVGASSAQESLSLAEAVLSRSAELLRDPSAQGEVYERLLHEVEVPLLSSAIELFDNECAPAARALGLHRTTLKKKLDQYELGE